MRPSHPSRACASFQLALLPPNAADRARLRRSSPTRKPHGQLPFSRRASTLRLRISRRGRPSSRSISATASSHSSPRPPTSSRRPRTRPAEPPRVCTSPGEPRPSRLGLHRLRPSSPSPPPRPPLARARLAACDHHLDHRGAPSPMSSSSRPRVPPLDPPEPAPSADRRDDEPTTSSSASSRRPELRQRRTDAQAIEAALLDALKLSEPGEDPLEAAQVDRRSGASCLLRSARLSF